MVINNNNKHIKKIKIKKQQKKLTFIWLFKEKNPNIFGFYGTASCKGSPLI